MSIIGLILLDAKTYLSKLIHNYKINKKFGNQLKIDTTASVSLTSEFEGMNRICAHARFDGKMGLGSYIGESSILEANIGRFTSIGSFVHSNNGTHPYKYPFVSTSPLFFSNNKRHNGTFAKCIKFNEFRYADDKNKTPVIIENDCWIGDGSFIIGGITIHNGAMVLANAVVTKDVPPYAIVGGVPAEVKGYRYDAFTIDKLLKSEWWNNNKEWFEENWTLFCDMDSFMSKYVIE